MSGVAGLIASTPWLGQASFIIATGRSGSTLLRSLLDGHPELVVWPFEWAYFSAFAHFARNRPGPYLVRDLVEHFTRSEFRQLEHYEGDLGGRSYALETVDRSIFFETLRRFEADTIDRRQFLQLVMYAFAQASAERGSPQRFVLTINQPCEALLDDFPGARVIAMIRDPLNTYVSTKRYYFKAADLSGVDRCAVYRPRAANGGFRFGLLETAISPIVFTYDWIARFGAVTQPHIVRLETLQAQPEAVMAEVANFLGVRFDPILARATICGAPHGSNMSSGDSSEGRVVKQTSAQFQEYLRDLTAYELWWASRMLERAYAVTGYERDSERGASASPGLLAALKPLKHEFPSRGGQSREGAAKRGLRWIAAAYAYGVDRFVLLRYSHRHVEAGWPYAR